MPNVRDSSATIGHDPLAERLVAQQRREHPDERHRRRVLALAAAARDGLERVEPRHLERAAAVGAGGQVAAERLAALLQVAHLGASSGGRTNAFSWTCSSVRSRSKRVRNALSASSPIFFC
jgi:hypothetical protein